MRPSLEERIAQLERADRERFINWLIAMCLVGAVMAAALLAIICLLRSGVA